jgi:hypothetical protein
MFTNEIHSQSLSNPEQESPESLSEIWEGVLAEAEYWEPDYSLEPIIAEKLVETKCTEILDTLTTKQGLRESIWDINLLINIVEANNIDLKPSSPMYNMFEKMVEVYPDDSIDVPEDIILVDTKEDAAKLVHELIKKSKEVPKETSDLYKKLKSQDRKEDYQKNIGKLLEKEEKLDADKLVECAINLFREDIEYISKEFLADSEEGRENSYFFRALMVPNPEGDTLPPIVITEPHIEPPKDQTFQTTENKTTGLHMNIYEKWVKYASDNLDSPRAAVIRELERQGGFSNLDHIYINLKITRDNKRILDIYLDTSYSIYKTNQLDRYGISHIYTTEDEEEGYWHEVQELILKDMLEEKIEQDATILATVITPRAVKRYKALAKRYLLKLDPDKSSPLYYRFLEFQELLEKVKKIENQAPKKL